MDPLSITVYLKIIPLYSVVRSIGLVMMVRLQIQYLKTILQMLQIPIRLHKVVRSIGLEIMGALKIPNSLETQQNIPVEQSISRKPIIIRLSIHHSLRM